MRYIIRPRDEEQYDMLNACFPPESTNVILRSKKGLFFAVQHLNPPAVEYLRSIGASVKEDCQYDIDMLQQPVRYVVHLKTDEQCTRALAVMTPNQPHRLHPNKCLVMQSLTDEQRVALEKIGCRVTEDYNTQLEDILADDGNFTVGPHITPADVEKCCAEMGTTPEKMMEGLRNLSEEEQDMVVCMLDGGESALKFIDDHQDIIKKF